MQFTILIEFLVPGLATTLLFLAIFPGCALPGLPEGMANDQTVTALLVLAVSYPVGVLANSLLFLLQTLLLSPRVRRSILHSFSTRGVNLVQRGERLLGARLEVRRWRGHQELFQLLRTTLYSHNIAQLNSVVEFHKSLQRLARGMLIPIGLAVYLTGCKGCWALMGGSLVLLASCLYLLYYSIEEENHYVALFFAAFVDQKSGQLRSATAYVS